MEEQFYSLFSKYLNDQCNDQEIELLLSYFKLQDTESDLKSLILAELNASERIPEIPGLDQRLDKVYADLNHRIKNENRLQLIPNWGRYAAAAAIILGLSISGYFLLHKKQSVTEYAANPKNDIAPGGNKAILTSNGGKIVLDSVKNGLILNQGNVAVSKNANGQISYHETNSTRIAAVIYDTITIPRGGTYKVTLSDGTKIWLNAATQIRYPEQFPGNERKVDLIYGEAYFEVVHNTAKPFRLNVNGQTIEDIGTKFNVNAYLDEPSIKTSLIEGSVKVLRSGQTVYLKPGQQAEVINGSSVNHISIVNNADMEEATAWKNGMFKFDHADIKTVMRQLSRWYDVDVEYDGDLPQREFSGKIIRNVNVSQILDILKFSKIHFKIKEAPSSKNEKKIIVTP